MSNDDAPRLKNVHELLEEKTEKFIASLLREAKKVVTTEELDVTREARRRSGLQKDED